MQIRNFKLVFGKGGHSPGHFSVEIKPVLDLIAGKLSGFGALCADHWLVGNRECLEMPSNDVKLKLLPNKLTGF